MFLYIKAFSTLLYRKWMKMKRVFILIGRGVVEENDTTQPKRTDRNECLKANCNNIKFVCLPSYLMGL